MSFGQRLKKQRIAAGLTQSELAKLSSITSRTIQNYELEASSPKNIEVVNKLANALGVSQSILFYFITHTLLSGSLLLTI